MRSQFVHISLMTILLLTATACASDSIENRQYGQQMVCHDGDETLAVSNADSFVHLNHGDAAGPCPDEN
jgi:hypothetical protein